ncbi:hypothetical protein BH09PSE2_BH09PSE2_17040 [soil metagenome]
MSVDPPEAQDALAELQASRRRLSAGYAHWSWGRHAAFAALLAALAAVQGLPLPFNVVGDVAVGLGALGVANSDRRRGMFVNGWRKGRTRWIAFVCLFVTTALGLFGLWLSRDRGLTYAPLAIGVVIFPMGLAASKLWEGVYRREMEQRA